MIHLHDFYSFFLIFGRVMAIFITFPVLSQATIPFRIRVAIGLAFSFFLVSLLPNSLPSPKAAIFSDICISFLCDVGIGLFLGLTARIIFSILDITGHIISFQLNLSNALLFNPSMELNAPIPAVFLLIAGGVIFFTTNAHHWVFRVLIDSYTIFPVGKLPNIEDMGYSLLSLLSRSFSLSLRFAFPFIIMGTILNASFGVLNKLMPQLMVFFLTMPLTIMINLLIFFALVPIILNVWIKLFDGVWFYDNSILP
ncbi:MAG: flagellar biosynthetic protein FliR [Alphaproteobacteria bacterium]